MLHMHNFMSLPLSSLPESILVPAELFKEQCADLWEGVGRQNIEQAIGVDVAGREELHGWEIQSNQHHNNNAQEQSAVRLHACCASISTGAR